MPVLDGQICYLLCYPDPVEKLPGPLEQIRGLKDAPYFQPVDISVRTLGQVEASLRQIARQFRSDPRRALRPGPTRGRIQRIVQHCLEVMLDFEHTDQNLLLTGYSVLFFMDAGLVK